MTYKAAAPHQAAASHCDAKRDSIESAFVARPLPRDAIAAGVAWRQMLADLQRDLDRYVYMQPDQSTQVKPSVRRVLRAILGRPGMWVMLQYRVSRWVHFHLHVPVLRSILKFVCAVWQKLVEMITSVELPNRAEIGGGVFIPHANGIVIHIDAKIGRNCNISQQVTIGVGGTDPSGTPTIGDRVFLGPGAKLFGPITVGDDVAIGANAVVMKDLPNHVVAVGIPAKVTSAKGSVGLVLYPGCKAHAPGPE
jgi:serine O-acetyltransferase